MIHILSPDLIYHTFMNHIHIFMLDIFTNVYPDFIIISNHITTL